MNRIFKIFFKTKKIKKRKVRRNQTQYLSNKQKAKEIAKDRLEYFNQFYGYKWNSIVIRNQKTRWGSCSKEGNLNFNYKIALLSAQLSDYIIVHELCHLGEFNHSRDFWILVEKTIPNYKTIRAKLKNNPLPFNLK